MLDLDDVWKQLHFDIQQSRMSERPFLPNIVHRLHEEGYTVIPTEELKKLRARVAELEQRVVDLKVENFALSPGRTFAPGDIVGEGLVVMPVEATPEMLSGAWKYLSKQDDGLRGVWSSMIAAVQKKGE